MHNGDHIGGQMATPLVPTRFVWSHGGTHVHLCGSFTRWQESLPMSPVEGHPNIFQVVCSLPPGYHQYKFIVDSEWRHDETQAYMPDPLGNVNNWVLVRDPTPLAIPPPLVSSHPPMFSQPALGHEAQSGYNPGSPGMEMEEPSPSFSSIPHASSTHHMHNNAQRQAQAQAEAQAAQAHAQAHAQAQAQAQAQAAAGSSISFHQPLHTGPLDAPMAAPLGPDHGPSSSTSLNPAGSASAASLSASEVEASRQRLAEFLNSHQVHELMPESGKVVALDVNLPVKQAFHALYEHGLPCAPVWDSAQRLFVGMLSCSDFMAMLTQLRGHAFAVSARAQDSGSARAQLQFPRLSEEELERLSIREWKAAKLAMATAKDVAHTPTRRPLLHVGPDDTLRHLAEVLLQNGVASVPVLSHGAPSQHAAAGGQPQPQLLQVVSLAEILKCIGRHMRHLSSSLPLLAQPIGSLPLGTWVEAIAAHRAGNSSAAAASSRRLTTVSSKSLLSTALTLLLTEGVSCLPVVDESCALVDVYSRSDITALAKERAYTRLQFDQLLVSEALQFHDDPSSSSTPSSSSSSRCHMCLQSDSLRAVMDRLSVPGVRRVVCVEAGSRRVEGLISLSDIFHFLLRA